MVAMMQWLLHELGNGRAMANARRDRDELELLAARVEALGRRVDAAAPAPITTAGEPSAA